jgi:DNA gyrase subunit A
MAVKDLRVMGRATQGVRLIKIKADDNIAAVAKVVHEEEGENEESSDQSEESSDENGTEIENDTNENQE